MSSVLTKLRGDEEVAFGEVIRKYRRRRLWSQAELAEKIEISRPYLSKIENGRVPNGHQGFRLLVELGFTVGPAVTPDFSVLIAPDGEPFMLTGDELSEAHLEVSKFVRGVRRSFPGIR